jgi:glycerol-3-phosphate responsive antiterminator
LRKYQTWAYLNAEGKKLWVDVFPDGEVPIQSIIVKTATLEGVDGIERVFLVDWKELSAEQQNTVLEKISILSGTSKNIILKHVLKAGLPLREKYTEGCGTSRMGLFI